MPIYLALAALAGAGSVLAFSPFEVFPLILVSLGVLFVLLERVGSVRAGFALGFAWGLGAFLAGISWLYVALNRYGGVPMPVAALAIFLFCAYLALYPGLLGALYLRFRRSGRASRALLFGGLWVLAELARGWVFTGFPWLALGYSQTPPSPLAGWMPVIGVYGVGGVLAWMAAWLALTPWRSGWRSGVGGLLPVVVVLTLGALSGRIAWTNPVGEPMRVALAQTDIEQDLKWRPEMLQAWLNVNAALADGHDADLVVLPETSLPLLVEHLPEGYLDLLAAQARQRNGDVVAGVFSRDEDGKIYNAAISLGMSSPQFYAKQHLVPFGEYSPPLFGWFYRLADIPMSNQSPGQDARPMRLGGQKIAINICYEDLFGRALIRSLPEATLMLNLSNLAWYGNSFAQPQHLQIARVRALETGRPMLRSTNTGMTALVMPDGEVTAALPPFERGVLEVSVRGYQGQTPYAIWGDWLAVLLALGAVVFGARLHRSS